MREVLCQVTSRENTTLTVSYIQKIVKVALVVLREIEEISHANLGFRLPLAVLR